MDSRGNVQVHLEVIPQTDSAMLISSSGEPMRRNLKRRSGIRRKKRPAVLERRLLKTKLSDLRKSLRRNVY